MNAQLREFFLKNSFLKLCPPAVLRSAKLLQLGEVPDGPSVLTIASRIVNTGLPKL